MQIAVESHPCTCNARKGKENREEIEEEGKSAFLTVYSGFLCYDDGFRLRVLARISFSGEASAVRLQVVFLKEG